jgi:Family of unknown function (DUF6491)
MKKLLALAMLGAVAAPAFSAQAEAPKAKEVSIPFVRHGGIRDWEVVDRETVYIQDRRQRWYVAKLMGPCQNLNFATRIGFVSDSSDSFDRFSSILAEGRKCQVESLTAASGPPPRKPRR